MTRTDRFIVAFVVFALGSGFFISAVIAQTTSVQQHWEIQRAQLTVQGFVCTEKECRRYNHASTSFEVCNPQACFTESASIGNQPPAPEPTPVDPAPAPDPQPNPTATSTSSNQTSGQPATTTSVVAGTSTSDFENPTPADQTDLSSTDTDQNNNATVNWYDSTTIWGGSSNAFLGEDDFAQSSVINMERVCGNIPAARCSEGVCPNAADGRPQICQRSAGGCGCVPVNPPPNPNKKPQCSDGIDNDRDKKVDYPADFGCVNRNDNDERNAPPGTPKPPANPIAPIVNQLRPGGAVPPGLRIFVNWRFKAPGGALLVKIGQAQVQFRLPGGAVAAGLRMPRG